MAETGVRKAALLLRSLDPDIAGELLKAASPDVVKQIVAELVYMDATGQAEGGAQPAVEFLGLLHNGGGRNTESFLQSMVASAVGRDRLDDLLGEVRRMVDGRDPFIPIRQAEVPALAEALRGLHPQAAAMVLMELPPERSATLIPMLEESVRGQAVRRMAMGERVSVEAQTRVAALIRDRLDAQQKAQQQQQSGGARPAQASPDDRLRRVALLMRRLRRELRDTLLESIRQQNADQAREIQDLMVTWEDLLVLADRNLQDILRTMDAEQLALAIQGADPKIEQKIRSNISERAAAMIDEEISLMRKPKPEDIEAARERILSELRQLNAAGELTFEDKTGHGPGPTG